MSIKQETWIPDDFAEPEPVAERLGERDLAFDDPKDSLLDLPIDRALARGFGAVVGKTDGFATEVATSNALL